MADPIIVQSTLAMTGAAQSVDLGFVPDLVFAWLDAGASAKPWAFWSHTSWVKRTQYLANLSSAANGIHALGSLLLVGTDASVNVAGATLHYIAIADNKSGLVNTTGWMGSPAAWSPSVAGPYTSGPPDAVFVKRDANRSPCFRSADITSTSSILFDGTGVTGSGLTAINPDGAVSVGAGTAVNELSDGSIGEGHDALAFWARAGLCELVKWTGDGTAGRVIAHGVANAAMAIIIGNAAGTPGGMKLASMGTKMADASAGTAGIDDAVVAMAGGALTLGSDTRYNAAGVTYRALILGASQATQIRDIPPDDGKAVFVRGASVSRVDCGTDDSLSMAGAFSLEWWGRVLPIQNAAPAYLMARSAGDEGRADGDGAANGSGGRLDGTWSWAIGYHRFNDLGDWAGPQFFVCTTNYNNQADYSGSENDIRTKPWRTGILVPTGPFHMMVTHDGAGYWNLYLDGRLVKQRKIDMTQVTLADDAGTRVNAGAGSGHRTVLGARQGSSSIGNIGKQTMRGARVYAAALTAAQAFAMYRRNFLGVSIADMAPVEQWLAENAAGVTLAATMLPANNGAMTQAQQARAGLL